MRRGLFRCFHHDTQSSRPKPRAPIVMKDRTPHPGTVVNDGKRKLAVLVDASKVNGDIYPYVDDIVKNKGAICLRRYFDYDPKPNWKALETSYGFEWFRVDGFIPVHMQLAADAAHIIEYRRDNLISGICMVVTTTEAENYAKFYDRLKGNGVSLYVFHEKAIHPVFVEE